MKFRSTTTVLLFALLVLTSCIKDDRSKCALDIPNVKLSFLLDPDLTQTNQVFTDYIKSVDLLVYDEQGDLYTQQTVSLAELKEFQGAWLSLAAGQYHVMCWANRMDQATYQNTKTSDAARITYTSIKEAKVGNVDQVYYGHSLTSSSRISALPQSLELNVPKQGDVEKELWFKSSHKRINIYVRGFKEDKKAILPIVGISGLNQALSLATGQAVPGLEKVESRLYSQERVIQNTSFGLARFSCFSFELDNTIHINIYAPSSKELLYSVPLEEALEEAEVSFDAELIELTIALIEGQIEIIIPGWSSGEIGWE